MRQEELSKLNICPFDYGAMESNKKREAQEVYYILLLRYLALLVQQCQITFKIPYAIKYLGKKGLYIYDINEEEGGLQILQKKIFLQSGWNYGKCKLKGSETLSVDICSLKDMDLKDWKKAALEIPQILNIDKQGFKDVTIVVFWSERIARYHNYAALNPEEIKMRFQEGAVMIERILRKLADPYAIGMTFRCYGKEQYVMGHFEGECSEGQISFKDIDYNFYVQAVILHMLLACAEEMFGIPKWEVNYDI